MNTSTIAVCGGCQAWVRLTGHLDPVTLVSRMVNGYGWTFSHPHLFCRACAAYLTQIRHGAA